MGSRKTFSDCANLSSRTSELADAWLHEAGARCEGSVVARLRVVPQVPWLLEQTWLQEALRVGARKIIVKIDVPPMPKLKKGDIAIIHPAVQQLLDFVADRIVKDLIVEQAARLPGESSPTSDAVQGAVEPAEAEREYKKPEYEIISVDDAAKRFGTTRDAIMARFQQVTDEYYSLSKRSRAKLHARVRSAESAGAPTNQASPKRRRSAPR